MKVSPKKECAQRIRNALSNILFAMAGNSPNYEEACRALFAKDTATFEELIQPWPEDIRDFAQAQAREASQLEANE